MRNTGDPMLQTVWRETRFRLQILKRGAPFLLLHHKKRAGKVSGRLGKRMVLRCSGMIRSLSQTRNLMTMNCATQTLREVIRAVHDLIPTADANAKDYVFIRGLLPQVNVKWNSDNPCIDNVRAAVIRTLQETIRTELRGRDESQHDA